MAIFGHSKFIPVILGKIVRKNLKWPFFLHDATTVATLPNTEFVFHSVGYCLYGTLLLRPRSTCPVEVRAHYHIDVYTDINDSLHWIFFGNIMFPLYTIMICAVHRHVQVSLVGSINA